MKIYPKSFFGRNGVLQNRSQVFLFAAAVSRTIALTLPPPGHVSAAATVVDPGAGLPRRLGRVCGAPGGQFHELGLAISYALKKGQVHIHLYIYI
jgi:hypothetical protein